MRKGFLWSTFLVALVASLTGVILIAAADDDDDEDRRGKRKFDIGLIGDTRYTAEQQTKFLNLLEDMNGEKLAFVVHDGDIKSGSSPCADHIYHETRDLFEQFKAPLIYTPGDNEWTDCHRAGGDPPERLAFLRRVFYPDAYSLGQRQLRLNRQSEEYPENARWVYGAATFGTLHVVGSNNNKPVGGVGNEAEYRQRNAANLEWIRQIFDEAKAHDSIAVMLVMQANMWDDIPPAQLAGFADTISALERAAIAFSRPVVLVHGDSHYFRIDKPLLGSTTGRRLENFTRAETFGTDDVHWTRVTIDAKEEQVFVFRQQIVRKNLVDHTP